MRTEADVAFLLNAVDSPHNGITMCVGTFGSHAGNDVEGMVERFKERIHFVHLRNVQQLGNGLSYYRDLVSYGSYKATLQGHSLSRTILTGVSTCSACLPLY